MSKTIRHTVDSEAKANKRVPQHKRERRETRLTFRFFGIDDYYIEHELTVNGEPKPRGWWTG